MVTQAISFLRTDKVLLYCNTGDLIKYNLLYCIVTKAIFLLGSDKILLYGKTVI